MAADRRPRKGAAPRSRTTAPRSSRSAPSRPKRSAPAKPRARSAPTKVPANVLAAVQGAFDKKAEDLQLLDLRGGPAFTDFFVICTGNNIRQVQAIADGVQDAMRAHGERPALIEGYDRGEWILIDFFDFIVHVFTAQTRQFYALDRLWGDAEKIAVSAT